MAPARRKFLHLVAGAATLPVLSRRASALDYPTRPVHVIVGFPEGGGPNVVAHIVAAQLSGRLGQQFVVESRPGAGSSVAAEYVVTAPLDGYTLLVATGANAVNASLYAHLSFNFVRDFSPVAIIVKVPFLLVVNPSLPVKTLPEFIAYAKANPGTINVASPGVGTTPHLAIELLKMDAHVDVVHVPYRASYVADLLGGQVQAAVSTITQVIEFIRQGKLRALAVTSTTRSETLPGVPAIGELLAGYDASSWFGVCAPKGTPAAVVDQLNNEINSVVAVPDVKKRLTDLGVRPFSMNTTSFGKLIADETEKWAKVIQNAGIKRL
jgi:tripartite-type tricarboxylate transporter receptor subunit TctC